MKAPEHSPLPWTIEEHGEDRIIVDATGDIIAEPDYRGDARLIITAVNSHAELLAAAKEVVDFEYGDCPAGISSIWDRLVNAIAKAEATP